MNEAAEPGNAQIPRSLDRPVRRRPRSIITPVVLIGLGLVLLGQNFGLLPDDLWTNLWRLWPLLLILVGIDLAAGRASWATAVSVVLLVVAVGSLGALPLVARQAERWSPGNWPFDTVGATGVERRPFGNWSLGNFSFGLPEPASAERVVEDLGDARQAIVDLRHGAGRLDVAPLSADSAQLIDAELMRGESAAIDRNVDRQGGQVEVRLRGRADRFRFLFGNAYREDWTIKLSRQVVADLRIRSGAGELNLDLGELVVTRLDVQSGAGNVKIAMPQAAGRTEARIRAGAAHVEVTIPQGVAGRIHARGGLSSTTIDQSRFQKAGNYYQSPDYDTATNRVSLDVETGVSSLTIR